MHRKSGRWLYCGQNYLRDPFFSTKETQNKFHVCKWCQEVVIRNMTKEHAVKMKIGIREKRSVCVRSAEKD